MTPVRLGTNLSTEGESSKRQLSSPPASPRALPALTQDDLRKGLSLDFVKEFGLEHEFEAELKGSAETNKDHENGASAPSETKDKNFIPERLYGIRETNGQPLENQKVLKLSCGADLRAYFFAEIFTTTIYAGGCTGRVGSIGASIS